MKIINNLMRSMKTLLMYWWKKQLVTFGVIAGIVGFTSAFGIMPEKYGWQFFAGTVFIGFIIAVIWGVIDRIGDGAKTGTNIQNREGTRRSLSNEYVDTHHKIQKLLRQDLLDYIPSKARSIKRGGNFVSFRVIKGKNVSSLPTDGFVYLECSEYKLQCKDVIIKAYDLKSNKELRVDFVNRNNDEKYFEFPFKIRFSAPLSPGEEFEIAYRIILTNELNVLRYDDEHMSISLTRYPRGVEELEFNVCLNFEPKSAQAEYRRGDALFLHNTRVSIEKYVPITDVEKLFTMNWSEQPYIIRWKCHRPHRDLYVIKFRK